MKMWNECKYLKNRIKHRYCEEYAKKLCDYLDIWRQFKNRKKIKEVSELSNSVMNGYYWSIYYTKNGCMSS